MTNQQVGVYIIAAFLGGIIASVIAYSKVKTTSTLVTYFVLGALFPLIGIIIACVIKTPPKAPGWYRDPWDQRAIRYHDGRDWTANVALPNQ